MSYTKLTDYAAKDALLTGDPNKKIKGTELGAEFDAIVTADAQNVKLTEIQTLTQKTLTSPVINTGDINTPDIDGGTVDGAIIGGATPAAITGTAITGNTSVSTPALTATSSVNFAGATVSNLGTVTTADINGGTIDGTVIGGSSAAAITGTTITASTSFAGALNGTVGATTPAAGTFTTLTSTGNAALGDAEATDTHSIKGATTLLANSASAALTVTQTGSGNAFVVEDSASPDSTPLIIDLNGNLVAGHTAIIGVGDAAALIQNHRAGSAGLVASRWTANAVGPIIAIGKSRGAAVGTLGIVQDADTLGELQFAGDDGTDLLTIGAKISAFVDGTPGTNDMPGRLVFATTADGASSPTERMRIDSAGNVGIGTTPDALTRLNTAFTASSTSSAEYGAVFSLTATAASGSTAKIALRGSASTFTGYASTGRLDAVSGIVTNGYAVTVASANAHNAFISNTSTGTITSASQYLAVDATNSGGGTITNLYGLNCGPLTAGVNNYGVYSNVAAATGRWNFYAAGTASNYFGGNVGVGGTLGYTTGAGGTVTQGTSRTTGVTLNKTSGAITLVSAAGSTSWQTFTVTNSTVAATDTITVNQKSGTDKNMIHVTAVGAGSFDITFATTGGTTTEQPVFNFNVIKGVTS